LGLATGGVAVLLVTLLATLTWRQVGVWHDSERLWTNALEIAPSSVVHSHLAYVRRQQGRWAEVDEHYRQAASMPRVEVVIQTNRGTALAQRGRFGEAIDRFREALRLRPQNSVPHYFWGNALFASGELDAAIRHYREAARLDPGSAETYNNWGTALAQQGNRDEAIGKFREALRIKPDYPLASANLSRMLGRQGQPLSAPPAPGGCARRTLNAVAGGWRAPAGTRAGQWWCRSGSLKIGTKPFTANAAPTTARTSENQNIWREVARIDTEAVTIAICRSTSPNSKYGCRSCRWSRIASSLLASASIAFVSPL